MIPYLVLLGVICVEGILILNSKRFKDRNKVFLTLVAVEMIIFVGLRDTSLGSDTDTYLEMVDMFRGISFSEIFDVSVNPFGIEPGYLIFSKMCSFLGITGTKFLFLIAAVCYIPYFKFVYCESKSPVISTLTYFAFSLFYYSLGIFRQMIAISICLCAVPALKQRKPIKYCMIIIFASLFHATAICWLLLYWLSGIDINRYRKLIVPIGLLSIPLGGVISSIILMILPRYESYIGREQAQGGGSYLMLLLLIISYLAIQKKVRDRELSKIEEISIAATALAIVFQGAAYSFGIMGRGSCYYSLFEAIVIPGIIQTWFTKESQNTVKLLVCIVLIGLTIATQFYGNKYICPFTFVWET